MYAQSLDCARTLEVFKKKITNPSNLVENAMFDTYLFLCSNSIKAESIAESESAESTGRIELLSAETSVLCIMNGADPSLAAFLRTCMLRKQAQREECDGLYIFNQIYHKEPNSCKMITKLKIAFALLFLSTMSLKTSGQDANQMVRIAKIVIDSTQLSSYNTFLKEEIETSVKVEPGVLTLYAVAEKNKPTHITILEIYANVDAYKKHIQTPHFLKYKHATKDMVKSLELVETVPLVPGMKIK